MDKKGKFIVLVEKMMNEVDIDSLVTEDEKEDALHFWESFKTNEPVSDITDTGKLILGHLNSIEIKPYTAKEIAESLGVGSRTVSGSMRKLVENHYVDKVSLKPTTYQISNEGQEKANSFDN